MEIRLVPFAAVKAGSKTTKFGFFRLLDREYEVCDNLLLREWGQTLKAYIGLTCGVRVTYVTDPCTWRMPPCIEVHSIAHVALWQASVYLR